MKKSTNFCSMKSRLDPKLYIYFIEEDTKI